MIQTQTYNGEMAAGSLLIHESRQIARLLLDGVDAERWDRKILIENILQKRSPRTSKRQARLIRNRLSLMNAGLWEIIANASFEAATQAVLSAAIKHSRLIGDFMDQVIRRHWQTFTKNLTVKDWNDFLETCAQIDPRVDGWSPSTQAKLRQVLFRILAESGYIENTKTRLLLPVSVIPEIRINLMNTNEKYVLRCLEVTP